MAGVGAPWKAPWGLAREGREGEGGGGEGARLGMRLGEGGGGHHGGLKERGLGPCWAALFSLLLRAEREEEEKEKEGKEKKRKEKIWKIF
jgi:hypothetical protein